MKRRYEASRLERRAGRGGKEKEKPRLFKAGRGKERIYNKVHLME
jgi:hypothetical protein